MEIVHLLAINILCIIISVFSLYSRIPLISFFGVLISITLLFYILMVEGVGDVGIRMFTILTIIVCCVSLIGGYSRNG